MPLRRPLLWPSRWLFLAVVAMGPLMESADTEEPKKPTRDATSLSELPPGAIRRLHTVWHPIGSPVGGVAFSPDGRLLAASAGESALYLGDPTTFRTMRKLVAPEAHEIHCVAFSPDGLLVAIGDSDASVHLWELPEGTYYRRFEGHASTVSALAFHPKGELLASAGADHSVILWDMHGRIRQRLEGHRGDVTCLSFSPDGKMLATGSLDGTIRFWDSATGKYRRTLTTGSGVCALVITADGKSVIAEGAGHALCRWDLDNGRELGRLEGHRGAIRALALDPKRHRLASSSQDGSIRLWCLKSGREERRLDRKDAEALALAFSPEGQTLAIGNRYHIADLWQLDRKELRPMRDSPRAVLQAVGFVGFDEGDRVLLTRVMDEEQRWDAATGKLLGKRRLPPLVPPGRIRVKNADGSFRIYVTEVFRRQNKTLSNVDIVWSEQTEENPGKPSEKTMGHLWPFEIRCLALSPDSKMLAVGQSDGRVFVREVASLCNSQISTGPRFDNPLVLELQGHQDAVTCLAFSRNGRFLISGSEDATAVVWDLAVCPVNSRQSVKKDDSKDLWAALGADDEQASRAFLALQVFHARPDKGLALLKPLVPPACDVKRLPQLLRDLDADEFEVRKKAYEELARMGRGLEDPLKKALTENPSPEVRSSIRRLLDRFKQTPEVVRAWGRAVIFLERDGSRDGREILEALVKGHPSPRVVADARAALDRMKPPVRKR